MTMTTAPALPEELKQYIQGKFDVLNEELVIDGKTMTVAQVAQSYRNLKAQAVIMAVMASLLAAMLVIFVYWFTAHPIEKVVAMNDDPANLLCIQFATDDDLSVYNSIGVIRDGAIVLTKSPAECNGARQRRLD